MEMEDHNHNHHHHHEHHQHYGTTTSNTITDLTQLITIGQRSTTSHFPTAELFPSGNHPNLAVTATQQQYEMMMFGRQVADIMPRSLHDFVSTDSAVAVAATTTTTSASTPSLSGNLEAETTGCIGAGGSIVDASTGRWPRQETLTLLEIRSRLDPQFKEATQKGPLWDQLSR